MALTFKGRLLIATRNVGTQKALKPVRGLAMGDITGCLVPLAEFAAWAMSLNWKIPQELAELVHAGADTPRAMTDEQCAVWTRKDLWTVRETAFLLCGRLPDRHARLSRVGVVAILRSAERNDGTDDRR